MMKKSWRKKMKYKKKPVIVEAIQWTGNANSTVINDFSFIDAYKEGKLRQLEDKLLIDTLEGTMTANVGDYIIKGVKGEFYPCKPDVFIQTYDLVE